MKTTLLAMALFALLQTSLEGPSRVRGPASLPPMPAQKMLQLQNNLSTAAGQTSISVNVTTTSGHLLVAWVREGSNNTDNFTVTDSASQSWTLVSAGYVSANTTHRAGLFYKANSAAVTSVTANFTTGGGVTPTAIVVGEINSAVTSGAEDSSVNSSTSNGVFTWATGSLTTTNANDILVAAFGSGGNITTWTPGFDFSLLNNLVATGASSTNARLALAYRVVSASQSGVTTLIRVQTSAPSMVSTFAGFKIT